MTINRIKRPLDLPGKTYQISPPVLDENVYITINDCEVGGQLRPVEIFINSRNMQSFAWISCVTRLLSAIQQIEGEFPWFVIDELQDTYDPLGGYMIPRSNGKRAHSVVGHIGYVLEQHCRAIGLERPKKEKPNREGNHEPNHELNRE